MFGDAAPLAQAPHATDSLPDPARVGPPEEAPSPHPLRHVLETAVDRHGVEATANALTSLLSQVPAGVGAGWVLLHAPLLGFLVLMATCGAWGAGLASQGTLRCGGAGGACMRALVPTDAMPCTPLAPWHGRHIKPKPSPTSACVGPCKRVAGGPSKNSQPPRPPPTRRLIRATARTPAPQMVVPPYGVGLDPPPLAPHRPTPVHSPLRPPLAPGDGVAAARKLAVERVVEAEGEPVSQMGSGLAVAALVELGGVPARNLQAARSGPGGAWTQARNSLPPSPPPSAKRKRTSPRRAGEGRGAGRVCDEGQEDRARVRARGTDPAQATCSGPLLPCGVHGPLRVASPCMQLR